ncbi:MAG TPA: hypothetical protein DEG17_09650 [Cyanobacteria bacterium UBA11149]|nr:hypothetical protein [Cyanobacteria bacterium UBA11367]HBE58319.1 hypothetical protein [Cyanobacteria bacterium UBA11366]HBK62654.1 hypothetical protein [Cyanobacteria bacterium UBA11166]HBR76294.1 hypothetical protein [Cyanobacteria bacterium UBA11159]HBS72515.1 hypothetical protein [Cyanobacteria bacterium UBA11153]HBW89112.1 hypothetical protein [Cyanobacteria bacterium UBA11149]HCA93688.1 hypothetical protein [Cyanobacteria bacterium UBA9226]
MRSAIVDNYGDCHKVMKQKRILIQRIISPDGRRFAQGKSIAFSSGESGVKISQKVTVKIFDDELASSTASSSATNFSFLNHS